MSRPEPWRVPRSVEQPRRVVCPAWCHGNHAHWLSEAPTTHPDISGYVLHQRTLIARGAVEVSYGVPESLTPEPDEGLLFLHLTEPDTNITATAAVNGAQLRSIALALLDAAAQADALDRLDAKDSTR